MILIQDKSRRNIEPDEFQLKSNIFFIHPDYNTTYGANNFDICLVQTPPNEYGVYEDLSTNFDFIPCLPDKEIELEKVYRISMYSQFFESAIVIPVFLLGAMSNENFQEHGKSCWVAGWGQSQSNSVSSDSLKSIGVNLFDHRYCYNHR